MIFYPVRVSLCSRVSDLHGTKIDANILLARARICTYHSHEDVQGCQSTQEKMPADWAILAPSLSRLDTVLGGGLAILESAGLS